MPDIVLTTRPGAGLDRAVYADRDTTGATITVEYGPTSKFTTVSLTKTPTVAGRRVELSLSTPEVESLKDSHFRVQWTKGAGTRTILTGRLNFEEPKVDGEFQLPERLSEASLRESFVPGRVIDQTGATVPTKRLNVVLDANGDIDDLIIEDVA